MEVTRHFLFLRLLLSFAKNASSRVLWFGLLRCWEGEEAPPCHPIRCRRIERRLGGDQAGFVSNAECLGRGVTFLTLLKFWVDNFETFAWVKFVEAAGDELGWDSVSWSWDQSSIQGFVKGIYELQHRSQRGWLIRNFSIGHTNQVMKPRYPHWAKHLNELWATKNSRVGVAVVDMLLPRETLTTLKKTGQRAVQLHGIYVCAWNRLLYRCQWISRSGASVSRRLRWHSYSGA